MKQQLKSVKRQQFFKIGDKVESIKPEIGAWFPADIISIYPSDTCECSEVCSCIFKLLFESDDDVDTLPVDRTLNGIRQVTYNSLDWNKLKPGMRVVINYNIDNPQNWGLWYDYVIDQVSRRENVTYLKGTLLVGCDGISKKIPVEIDSDNVADVLEIRPHVLVAEKESANYVTGIKPEYCTRCKNKPRLKCKKCCCRKCGCKRDLDLTVQCDECFDWYHTYCLDPPLNGLPPTDDDWYCPKCNNETRRKKMQSRPNKRGRKRKVFNELKVIENEILNESSQKRVEAPLVLKRRGRKILIDTSNRPKRGRKKLMETPDKPKRGRRKNPDESKLEEKDSVSNDHCQQQTKERDDSPKRNDIEMKAVQKENPAYKDIWDQVLKSYPDYDVLQIFVGVREKDELGDDYTLSPKVERLISNDVDNELLWTEAKATFAKGKKAFLDHVQRLFTCSICCELMKDPITLSCKHSFCISCFFKSLGVNVYNCALCRVDVIHTQHYVVNENLSSLLRIMFKKHEVKSTAS